MSARVLALLQERRRVTPDFPELNKRGLVPLFAYGWEKKSKAFGWILDEAEYYGEALTVNSNFQLKKPSIGSNIPTSRQFPIALECHHNQVSADGIWGELYGVTPLMIHALDAKLHRGSMTQRIVRDVDLSDNSVNKDIYEAIPAFMYVGNNKVYDKVRSLTFPTVEKPLTIKNVSLQYSGYYCR